jgi:Ni/Co efflux regulator RcnB
MKKLLLLLMVSFGFVATSLAQNEASKSSVHPKAKLAAKNSANTEKEKQKISEERKKQNLNKSKSSSDEAAMSNAAPTNATTGSKK